MADFDLSELSLDELKALKKDVEKALKAFETRRRKEALAAAEAAAKNAGFALAELFDGTAKAKKPAAAPKYRHPENSALTWSGRGRQPAWYKELVDSGTPPEELLIPS